MLIETDPRLPEKLHTYDDLVRERLQHLRDLIVDTARSIGVEWLEETLKWGEPAFIAPRGSTFRIDGTASTYAVFFHCQSRLIPTFRRVFEDVFTFEGDRAILFDMADDPPEDELRRCFAAALQYHDIKHLPELGL